MRHHGLRSVRNSYRTCEATFSRVEIKKHMGLIIQNQKPHFFSSDRREKIGFLRGYCRDKGPKNICWALSLVQEQFVVQGQINSNEDVRLRTP